MVTLSLDQRSVTQMYINDDASFLSTSLTVLNDVSNLSSTSPPSPSLFIVDVSSQRTDDEESLTSSFPSADLDDAVTSTTYFPDVNSTSIGDLTAAGANALGVQLPVGVVIVIVLASACVLLGAVYGYIYFTRMGTRSTSSTPSKTRKSVSAGSGAGGSDHHGGHHGSGDAGHDDAHPDSPFTYTHMFLFRKHSNHRATIT